MAAKKQNNNRRNTAASKSRSNGKKNYSKRNQEVSEGFGSDILLLILLAVSILLILSYLGICGVAGKAISTVLFGVMGLMTYVFPVILFFGAVFLISNKGNVLVYKKLAAALAFFIFLCGILQLLTEGYMKNMSISDYYALCSDYHTGGGVIGGAICISTTSAFGVAGGYVIMILVLMISLIIMTQRSFFGFIGRIWDGICGAARNGQERYAQGQPERDLKKEIRMRKKEARQAERLRRLEEELEEAQWETADDKASEKNVSGAPKDSSDLTEEASALLENEFQKPSFLDGTRLTAPKAEQKRTARSGRRKKTIEAEIRPESVASEDHEDGMTANQPEAAASAEVPEEEETPLALTTSENRQGQLEFKIHRSDSVDYEEEEQEREEQAEFEPDKIVQPQTDPDRNMPDRDMMDQNIPVQEPLPDFSEDTAGLPETSPEPSKPSRNPRSSQKEIDKGIQNIRHEIDQLDQPKREYVYPPLKLLKKGSGKSQGDSDAHLRKTAQKLQEILHTFGVNATVTNVSCGPTVTRYELQPEMGVKVSKIVGLADDIKLNLATPDIRIEAPIPGKAAVGIEVPNKENHAVMLRELLQSAEFQTAKSKLSFAVGKDIAGNPVVADIAKMPHVLIAGATGSGKSVCINTLIISLLYKASPEDVKLIMIDPKVVELSVYNGIPHLFTQVVTDPKKAAGALNWAVSEMMSRYNAFAEFHVRNLEEYNHKVENMKIPEGEERPEKMPQIVIIVDELADLMMVAPGEVEDAICRLAQLARAAGIHLIIATQRPSVNVITGLIKANMPSRIAFSVSSGVDSRTILDMNGAEKLLGKGDMLFYPQGYPKPARLQGAFVSDEEVSAVVDFLSNKNPGVEYSAQIEQQISTSSFSAAGGGNERDSYFVEAGKFIIDKDKASIGMLQRQFKIGFNRAARVMDQLCDAGVVGPEEGTKPRKVLMSMSDFETYIEEVL